MGILHNVNEGFADSAVGRYFHIHERKSCLTTEMRAGFVTFLTVAYILATNSLILSDSGGPCKESDCTNPGPTCKFDKDPGYEACIFDFKKSIVTATAASSLIATFLMGAFANMPLAVAPSMGINAYFTYNVVGYRGTGSVTYEAALAAAFVEGFIFILLAITGARGKLIQLVPKSIMLATSGGIGLFLAMIGFQTSEGIGLVSFEPATLVTLGGCPVADRAPMYTVVDPTSVCSLNPDGSLADPNLGPASANYQCLTNRMRNGALWLGIFGGFLMVLLLAKKVKGALMGGILMITFISWIPNHEASFLGKSSQIPGGADRMHYFKKVVDTPDASKSTLQWSFSDLSQSDVWIALITFLYLDFLDATGTLFSMANFINRSIPGMMIAFCVDGVGIIVGSILGSSPLTVYIESASGIKEGGRTGVTALVTSFFFFIALFFTPLIVSIPPYATGPALILVGAIMMENLAFIDWTDVRQGVPAFLTMAVMPFTYSIAYGVIAGLFMYIFLYVMLLGIDLSLAIIMRRPIKPVLIDAIPEAFQTTSPEPSMDGNKNVDASIHGVDGVNDLPSSKV